MEGSGLGISCVVFTGGITSSPCDLCGSKNGSFHK